MEDSAVEVKIEPEVQEDVQEDLVEVIDTTEVIESAESIVKG